MISRVVSSAVKNIVKVLACVLYGTQLLFKFKKLSKPILFCAFGCYFAVLKPRLKMFYHLFCHGVYDIFQI